MTRGACPLSSAIHIPGIPAEAGLGPGRTDAEGVRKGPVYTVFQGIPRNLDLFPPSLDGWRSARILVVGRTSYLGPVLIRGARLDGESPVAFGSASGRNGELRLPAGRWDELKGPVNVWGQTIQPRPRLRVAVVDVWAKAGGCYGLQMDGGSFSYRIVFHGAWQP